MGRPWREEYKSGTCKFGACYFFKEEHTLNGKTYLMHIHKRCVLFCIVKTWRQQNNIRTCHNSTVPCYLPYIALSFFAASFFRHLLQSLPS